MFFTPHIPQWLRLSLVYGTVPHGSPTSGSCESIDGCRSTARRTPTAPVARISHHSW